MNICWISSFYVYITDSVIFKSKYWYEFSTQTLFSDVFSSIVNAGFNTDEPQHVKDFRTYIGCLDPEIEFTTSASFNTSDAL